MYTHVYTHVRIYVCAYIYIYIVVAVIIMTRERLARLGEMHIIVNTDTHTCIIIINSTI